jgi:hypothetical protein
MRIREGGVKVVMYIMLGVRPEGVTDVYVRAARKTIIMYEQYGSSLLKTYVIFCKRKSFIETNQAKSLQTRCLIQRPGIMHSSYLHVAIASEW